jgi:Ca2+-binding RTX toxin-like protein
MLVGGADNDTLDGGANNDILKGGAGNDTYSFTGGFGTDIVTDSDGSGGIKANGQTLGGGAQQKLKDIYQDEASGYTYVKLNGGTSLAIFKEGEADRILVRDWSSGKLGVSLSGDVPTAPAATLAGDFKKKIDGHNTSATDDDTYVIDANNNYTPDPDNPVETNALDLISGTAGSDVIDGGGGDDIPVYSVRHIVPASPSRYPDGIQFQICGHAGIAPGSRDLRAGAPARVPAFSLGIDMMKVGAGGTACNGYWRVAA